MATIRASNTRRNVVFSLIVAITLAIALQPQPAHAGVATISQCKTAGGDVIDSSLASTSGGAGWLAGASCGTRGEGFALASFLKKGAEPTGAIVNTTFTAPGETRIVGFKMHRALRNYVYYSAPDRSDTSYDSWGLGYRLIDDSDRVLERCGAGTVPTSGRGNCSSVTGSDVLSGGAIERPYLTKRLSFQFGCFTAGYCSQFYDAPGLYDVYGDLSIEDVRPPSVSFTGGAMSSSGSTIGPNDATVTLGATDQDGLGLANVRLAVDGTASSETPWPGRPESCTDLDPAPDRYHYNAGQPCDRSPQTATLALPPTPDGDHRLTLSVVDAVGNATTAIDHRVIVDRLPPVLSHDPEVTGASSVGSVLQCRPPEIDAQSPTVIYQWIRTRADGSDAQEIASATSADYTVGAADVGSKLLCRVTATDRGGSTTRTSSLTSGPFDGGQTVIGGTASSQPSGSGGTTSGANDNGSAPSANQPNGSGSSMSSSVATLGTPAATTAGPSGQGSIQGPATPAPGCPVGTLVTLEPSSRLVAKRATSGTTVSGAVRSGTGAPAAGVVVDLVQRVRRDGLAPTTVATGTSGADGRFAVKAPVGPSRDLQVVTRSCGASGPVVGQSVRGQVKLKAVNPRLRNGQTVRFSGQAVGGYYGKGVGLELQVLVGRKWQDVRAVRTDRSGRFKSSYRFKRTYVRYTYRFRVITRATAGWPYTSTRSPVTKVRVN